VLEFSRLNFLKMSGDLMKEGRREGGKEGRREGGKEGRREEGRRKEEDRLSPLTSHLPPPASGLSPPVSPPPLTSRLPPPVSPPSSLLPSPLSLSVLPLLPPHPRGIHLSTMLRKFYW
jgi:hypothetical protein